MLRISIVIFACLFVGCQSLPKERSASSKDLTVETSQDELSDLAEALKNQIRTVNQSQEGAYSKSLVSILNRANLFPKKGPLVLMDLFCQIETIQEKVQSRCSFLKKQKNSWMPGTLKGEIAEELRLELSRFPVSLGDSGASVSFLRCEKLASSNRCEMAIDLNYSGP